MRNTDELWAEDLTDAELRSEYADTCDQWDASARDEDLGHGGSPLEYLSERIEEIETEAKMRGIDLAALSKPSSRNGASK